jgi:MOSC domain-containing protein YiiM
MAGRVEAIWIKRAVRGVMDVAEEAAFVAGTGIAGDCNYGRSKRQVTVIEREVFDRIRRTLPDAEPHMRRANIMVSGVRLEATRDHVLTLGGVRLLIKGETRPCERMDEQCPGLTGALSEGWGGGVFGIVLDDGPVRVGDAVALGRMVVTAVAS